MDFHNTTRNDQQFKISSRIQNQFTKISFSTCWKRGHGNISIHNHLQRIKYLGIILSKNVNDLYNENFNSQKKKEVKKETRQWEDLPCSWIDRINIVKMTILAKTICRLNAIHIKISMMFFTEIGKSILKFIWKHKGPLRVKAILSKINWTGGIIIPEIKLYYRATKIKAAWYWLKNRHRDQWSRTGDPKVRCTLPQSSRIWQRFQKLHTGRRTTSFTNGDRKNECSHIEELN